MYKNFEDKYTLEEAKIILKKEEEERRENFTYYLKQKLLGCLGVGVAIAAPIITGDATISLFMLPLGIYLIFTKDRAVV